MKRRIPLSRIVVPSLLAAAVAVGVSPLARAATWSASPVDANWASALNWDLVPAPGDPLVFGPSSLTALNNNLAPAFSVGGVTFLDTAPAYTLGGNSITLGGTVVNNSSALQSINFSILTSANASFNTGAAGISLGGTYTSTHSLTKTGTGTLTLASPGISTVAGFNHNQGIVNQAAGTLTSTGASINLGAAGNTATYNLSGGKLELVGTANGQSITFGGGGSTGILNASGAGIVNINGGELLIGEGGNGALNLSGDAKITLSQGAPTFNGVFLGRFNGNGTLSLADNASFASTRAGGILGIGGGWGADAGGPGQGVLLMSGNSTLTTQGGINLGLGMTSGNGANGSMTLNDNASISITGRLTVGEANSGAATSVPGSATVVLNGNSKFTTTGEIWIGQGASSPNNSITLNGTSAMASSGWFVVGRQGGTGTLTLNGGTVTKAGGGNFILGSLAGKGTVNLNNGTILNNADLILGENAGAEATFNLNGGLVQARAVIRNGAPTSSILNFNGGTLQATANSTEFINPAVTVNVRAGGAKIDTNSRNVTINAALSSEGPLGGLTKLGAGRLVLNAFNTYVGPTLVNAGSLVVGPSGSINISSGITVNGGAFVHNGSAEVIAPVTLTSGTVDGTGLIMTLNVANNPANIVTNGDGGTGTLNINKLTFSGAAALNLNVASTSPALAVADLVTSAAGKIRINASSGTWAQGDYNLVSYSTLTGAGFSAFELGTIAGLSGRQSVSLSNPAGYITLTVQGDTPVWTGALSTAWTTATLASPKNWNLQTEGTPTDFIAGDTVIFDDSAANTAVTIPDANVTPNTVIFNNGAVNYSLSGNFGIAGAAAVKLQGTGAVTLAAPSTYTGGTTLAAGALNLNHASAIGSGKLTINGGTLDNTSGAPITLSTNNNVELNANLTFVGTNPLDLGTGTLTLTGNRDINVNGGTLGIGHIAASAVNLNKGGPGTLNLNGNVGTLSQLFVFGGVVNQTGNVTVSGLTSIGLWGGNGTLVLSNAAKFNSVSGTFIVGDWGGAKGTLIVNNTASITTTGEIWIGSAATGPGNGEATVNDAGSITSGSWFCVGRDGALGVLTVNGGTVTKGGSGGNFIVGSLGGSGTVTLNGGSIVTNSLLILGENASPAARFNLNGGVVSANGVAQWGAASTAQLNFNGGILKATANSADFINPNIALSVQAGGALIDTNGYAITVAGNLNPDGSPVPGQLTKLGAGTLALAGTNNYGNTLISAGTLQVGSNAGSAGTLGTGPVTNNGTLAFARGDDLVVSNPISGTGALLQNGPGSATFAAPVSVAGNATISAGKFTFGGNASHAVKAVSGAGTLAVEAGATLTSDGVTAATWQIDGTHRIRPSGANAGTSKVADTGLVIAGSPGAWTGKLDLADNALLVTSASEGDQATAIAQLSSQVASGKAAGAWNGPGITSSTMTSSAFAAAHTLVVLDNGDVGLSTFRGQAGLDANSTLVLTAHNGDATLDGKVDAFDLNKLAANWQQTGKSWATGDFTLDGKVDAFDLNLLASNWQFGTAGSLEAALADFPLFGSAASGAIAAVPEPASLAVLALGGAALLGRRRRK